MASDVLFCLHCGAKVPCVATFCPRCGGELRYGGEAPSGAPAEPLLPEPEAVSIRQVRVAAPSTSPNSRRRVALWVLALFVVAAAGFTGAYLRRIPRGAEQPVAIVTPRPTQQQIVERYYEDLNARRFNVAFKRIANGWRSQIHYDKWRDDYRTTISQHAVVQQRTGGRYAVVLTAVDRTPSGDLTTRFSGSWKVVPDGHGGWLLDDPSFAKERSSFFDPDHPKRESIAETYAKIKQSLAIVASFNEYQSTIGTAFCIGSAGATSFFLTNRHVIGGGGDLRAALVSRPRRVYPARLVDVASDIDAAIIAVDASGTPAVALSDKLPAEGEHIGVGGFPAIQLELASAHLGLSPSFHEGTISAIVDDGRYVEFDAQTDHGNSGGPLFDGATGIVYGMVTYGVQSPVSSAVQANLAIPIARLDDFLRHAGVEVLMSRAAITGR